MSHSNRRARRQLRKVGQSDFEALETRRLLCSMHLDLAPAVELAPQTLNSGTLNVVPDPANIIWTNRANTTTGGAGDTDGFGATFGTTATVARAVVDAVIVSYERMIGSFNYSAAGQTYSLTLTMAGAGSGFGAGAGLGFSFGGLPKGGVVQMGAGNNDANANSDNGWFLDPTPFDNSEFTGNIVNAYSGDAPGASPAFNRGDFFTVVAAEMTHCMGLIGATLPLWAARTTNTGINDATTVGKIWVFQGPSIKHMLTSDNAGNTDTGSAVHAAEPTQSLVFGPDTYVATNDQGNPIYEFGRRYMINNTFGLMFKDAFNYLSVNPDQFGTMYSIYNETTDTVTVRGGDFAGGAGLSSDAISVTRSGNIVTVSVDVTNDLPGTGALPGAGNLPAFVTNYDLTTQPITSISINSSANPDSIFIGSNVGLPVSVDGGTGTDTVTFEGTAGVDTLNATAAGFTSGATTVTLLNVENLVMNGNDSADVLNVNGGAALRPITVNGGNGGDAINIVNANGTTHPEVITVNGGADASTDVLTMNDTGLANTATYTVTSTSINKNNSFGGANYSAVESILIQGESGTNIFNVNSTSVPVSIDGGVTLDTYNVNETGPAVIILSGQGSDVLNVNTDATGAAAAQFVNSITFGTINIASNGLANMTPNGSRVLGVTGTLSISGANARIELNDNDMIRDYTGGTQLSAVQALLNAGRAGGAWANAGITSSAAKNNPQHNTTLGAIEASDFKALYGAGATFDGQTIDTTAVLIKYTWYGDVDFNGTVDFDDYSRIDSGFNGNKTGWFNGDVDSNGVVDFDDYSLIDQAFNTQSGILRPAQIPLPNPGRSRLV